MDPDCVVVLYLNAFKNTVINSDDCYVKASLGKEITFLQVSTHATNTALYKTQSKNTNSGLKKCGYNNGEE